MATDAPPPEPPRVRIWDLPTRLFHWALVGMIAFQFWAVKTDHIDLHIAGGQVLLGLLLFRILWGFLGSPTARFANFIRGPGTVLRYLRGPRDKAIGHNPLGGWSVGLMLLLLSAQVGLGLFATDEDELESGPLAHLISFDLSVELVEIHETLFKVIAGLIVLHVAAVAFYYFARRDDLVTPMVTGVRGGDGEGIAPVPAWRFVVSAVVAVVLTLGITKGF